MEQDPNTGRTDGAPGPAVPPPPYQQPWGQQYAAPPHQPELAAGQGTQSDPTYSPGAMPGMPSMPSMPLPSSPYAPSQPYAPPAQPYPGYPGYGWPANATAPLPPSPYGYPAYQTYPGYPGYPGYQAPAAPVPRRGMPVWAIVLISLVVVLVIAGGMFGALAVMLPAEAGTLSAVLPAISATPTATPALTASPTLAANGRTFTDSLNGATNTGWSTDAYCFFKNGTYHVKPGSQYGSYTCFAPAGTFSNFDLRVSAQEVSGPLNYGYGLAFRRQSAHNFYTFVVASNGEAWFGKFTNGTYSRLSPFWSLRTFALGFNAANTLRVTAQGSTFSFYVNNVQAGSVSDATYTSGYVGLSAGDTNLEAAFSNFSITGVS